MTKAHDLIDRNPEKKREPKKKDKKKEK